MVLDKSRKALIIAIRGTLSLEVSDNEFKQICNCMKLLLNIQVLHAFICHESVNFLSLYIMKDVLTDLSITMENVEVEGFDPSQTLVHQVRKTLKHPLL